MSKPLPHFPEELRDRFEPQRIVGQTLRSLVYEARDRFLNRGFAIKITRVAEHEDSMGSRQRLQREVDAVVRLRNPHIVQIYEMLELEDNRVAFVMEMVQGETLDASFSRGPIAATRGLDLLHQLSNALLEVHERGMVHRDITPENLMIQPLPNGEAFLRVIDFGLVKTRDAERATDGFIGTPLYASPEHIDGELMLDGRADIFSAGAVIYHALSGRPPWNGRNLMELLQNRRLPAPYLLTVRPELDEFEELVDLVDRMLTLNRDDRIASMKDVFDVTERILDQHRFMPTFAELTEAADLGRDVVHFGLDADSSSVVWVDDEGCLRRNGDPSRVPTSARVTALCPSHGVIVGDEFGVVSRIWPDMSEVFQSPDSSPIAAVDATVNHTHFAVGTLMGRVYRGRLRDDAWQWTEGPAGPPVSQLSISPDGSIVAIARDNNSLEFLDGDVHRPIANLPGNILSMSWSRDNTILVILVAGQMLVFDRRGVQIYATGLDEGLVRLSFDSRGELLGLWDTPDGLETRLVDAGM